MVLSGQNIESIFMNCRQSLGSIHVPKELTVVSGHLNPVRDLKLGKLIKISRKIISVMVGSQKNPSWD
jgi:hypothetical protein